MSDAPRDAGILAPPPVLVLPFLVGGVVLRVVWNLEVFGAGWIGHVIGWPVLGVSFGLVVWAFRTFGRAGENPDVREPTGALVIGGPYRISRNPMYVAMAIGFVALGLVTNSWWFVIALGPVWLVIEFAVVRKEERYLEGLFGEEYREFRRRVRRWF